MAPLETMLCEEHQHFAATRFLNRLLDTVELDNATKQNIRLTGMKLLLELPYDMKGELHDN
jgi:hypothetical protein